MGKKRSNGEGSVHKTSSGTWRGQLMDGYTEDGKRKIVSFSGNTRSEVLEKMREFRRQVSANIRIDNSLTLNEWGDTWLADYQSQVQPSTYSSYKYTLKLLKTHLGRLKISEILPMHINRMQDAMVTSGYSLSAIQKCRAMLIQIFDSAYNNGLVTFNPAQRAKIIRDKDGSLSQPRYAKDAFSDDELCLLRHSLRNDLLGNSIHLMLNTGLRVQELLALTPEDIAVDGSSITVSKAIKMVDGIPTLGPPKSKTSNRTIPVPKSARSHALYLRMHGGKKHIWMSSGTSSFYSVGTFRRRYYAALKQIEGVRLLSPHCCRHTYVTQLQAKGVALELIARLAGHSDLITTHGYTHTSDQTLSNAVSVLNTTTTKKE